MYVHRLTRAIIAGIMLGIMVALNVILWMFLAIAVAWLLLVLYSWQIPPPWILSIGAILGLAVLAVQLWVIGTMVRR